MILLSKKMTSYFFLAELITVPYNCTLPMDALMPISLPHRILRRNVPPSTIYALCDVGSISPTPILTFTARLISLPSAAAKLGTAPIRSVGMLSLLNPWCFPIHYQALQFPHIPSMWTMAFMQYSLGWWWPLSMMTDPPKCNHGFHLGKMPLPPPPLAYVFLETPAKRHSSPFLDLLP